MKFAHFSHVWNKPGMTAAERYGQLWRELALADDCGFDFGFCVEHHFNPNESWMPSPSIYCAAAAAHTTRLRIGTMGFVAPLYDPIRIAEDAAVLDNIATVAWNSAWFQALCRISSLLIGLIFKIAAPSLTKPCS